MRASRIEEGDAMEWRVLLRMTIETAIANKTNRWTRVWKRH